jgi:subtilase family serine protease
MFGWAQHFFNTPTVPLTVSVSFMYGERDQYAVLAGAVECKQLGVDSKQYVARVNVELQKIGLLGVSIVVATGDNGANGGLNVICGSPFFEPEFPASSPFVTSVGATQLDRPVLLPLDESAPPACVEAAKGPPTNSSFACIRRRRGVCFV